MLRAICGISEKRGEFVSNEFLFDKKFWFLKKMSNYGLKQWAAVTMNFCVRIEHPHSCIPFNKTEHWYGANPSVASLPPTIRPKNTNGYQQFDFVMETQLITKLTHPHR